MMSRWNIFHTIFICFLSGYHFVGTAEGIFPKTQPLYTNSFLPAAIQVTQHLVDKIKEVIENPPDSVTEVPATTVTTDTYATATELPTLPRNISLSYTNVSTTTNAPLSTIYTSHTTKNPSPKAIYPPTATNMSSTDSSPTPTTINISPKTANILPVTLTTEMPSSFIDQQIKQTLQLQNSKFPIETVTESYRSLVPETQEQINLHNTDYCLLSVSRISEHPMYISDAAQNHEYAEHNGPESEGFVESFLKQNSTDKVHINTSSSTHRNESVQYMIATIVLTRLRDILAVEAKRQGLSKIQGYSTELLKQLASTSKMSSSKQLSFILKNMLKNRDAKRRESIAQSRIVLEGLSRRHSSLAIVLTRIPPLQYT